MVIDFFGSVTCTDDESALSIIAGGILGIGGPRVIFCNRNS